MPAETKYVFLDTEVLDRHSISFMFSPKFQSLCRLAMLEELELILTDVTVSEVRKHINDGAQETMKAIRDDRKGVRVVKSVLSDEQQNALETVEKIDLAETLQIEFGKFLLRNCLQIA